MFTRNCERRCIDAHFCDRRGVSHWFRQNFALSSRRVRTSSRVVLWSSLYLTISLGWLKPNASARGLPLDAAMSLHPHRALLQRSAVDDLRQMNSLLAPRRQAFPSLLKKACLHHPSSLMISATPSQSSAASVGSITDSSSASPVPGGSRRLPLLSAWGRRST